MSSCEPTRWMDRAGSTSRSAKKCRHDGDIKKKFPKSHRKTKFEVH